MEDHSTPLSQDIKETKTSKPTHPWCHFSQNWPLLTPRESDIHPCQQLNGASPQSKTSWRVLAMLIYLWAPLFQHWERWFQNSRVGSPWGLDGWFWHWLRLHPACLDPHIWREGRSPPSAWVLHQQRLWVPLQSAKRLEGCMRKARGRCIPCSLGPSVAACPTTFAVVPRLR